MLWEQWQPKGDGGVISSSQCCAGSGTGIQPSSVGDCDLQGVAQHLSLNFLINKMGIKDHVPLRVVKMFRTYIVVMVAWL